MSELVVRQGCSDRRDAADALGEVREAVGQPDARVVLLFCDASYDLDRLGREIARTIACPVLACTSAGQLGAHGYQRGGMAALSLGGPALSVQTHLLAPLSLCRAEALRVSAAIKEGEPGCAPSSGRSFGLLVVDGLSFAEEALTAALYEALGGMPFAGGSAADGLAFRRTAVYWDGAFRSDAAVLAAVETSLPFRTFRLHHFVPTDRKLVVTACDGPRRLLREIDGRPAVERYSELIGVAPDALEPEVFGRNPLLLRIGGEHHVRALRAANADGSLSLYCAIEEGLVLTVGSSADPLGALERGLDELGRHLKQARPDPGAPLHLGFDCILRRLAFEREGQAEEVGRILATHRVFGFSTYGEQCNALHVNQTLTGVALGG